MTSKNIQHQTAIFDKYDINMDEEEYRNLKEEMFLLFK